MQAMVEPSGGVMHRPATVPGPKKKPGAADGPSTSGVAASEELQTASTAALDLRKCGYYIGAAYIFIMTSLVVPIACLANLFLFLFPVRLFSHRLFCRLEHRLCQFVNDHWVGAAQYAGMQVYESGDDISKLADKRCLLLANHLGLVDHFVLMTSLHREQTIVGRYMWVIYNIWKKTPLGAIWTMHGNFFVNGGAQQRERLIGQFRQHLQSYFHKFDYGWVVMYPEGSRLYLIHESERRFAEKNGLIPLRHCAHPRTGAAHAVLDVLGPKEDDPTQSRKAAGPPIDYVIDVTIGYGRGEVPELGRAMVGEWPFSDVHVHYSVHPVRSEWGADEEKLKEWLYERYEAKDRLLDGFYRTGRFSVEKEQLRARPVLYATGRTIATQLFWLSTYYLHYTFWLRPLLLFVWASLF